MKLSRKTFYGILAVLLIAVSDLASSSEVPNPDDGSAKADLNHLRSILDVKGVDSDLTATSQSTAQNHFVSSSSPLPTKTVIYKKIKYRKIRKPVSNPSPVLESTTVLPPQVTSSESTSTSTSTTSTSTTTETPSTTTTEPPTTSEPLVDVSSSNLDVSNVPTIIADRREDVNVDDVAPPSQLELAQQLSLLNSLLTSLNDNVTTTPPTIVTTPSLVSPETVTSAPQTISSNDAQPAANNQTLAILNSIFGGRGIPPGGISNEDATAAVLGLSQGLSNVATRQIPIDPGTEGAKAISEFLLQAAAIEAAQKGNNNNFQNLNANLNSAASAAAANNQISSLVSILGTLNAIAPHGQGQDEQGLLGSGQGQGFQQSQILDPQQQVLAVLAAQQRDQANSPNQFADLLSQLPQHQGGGVGQQFGIGNIFGQGQGALGGEGGGILSTIGSGITSLGSSMITTFSNLLSGSGHTGKPRVRGVDTRLGLGYRFGDAADAQLMWDVGPQLFTEPVKNEQRSPTMTKKSHTVSADQDETDKLIQALIGNYKPSEIKAFPAAKRVLELQAKKLSHPLKKPFSLLEIWNAGKEPKSKQTLVTPTPSKSLQIPHQLLTPPVALNLNEADRLQMTRNKSFKKRSSSAQLKNYYSKPDDNPLSGHSTLTVYEQMLIAKGRLNLGAKFRDMMVEAPTPTTGRPSKRRKRPPPTPKVIEKEQEVDNQEEQLPTAEYGNNAELAGYTASKEQKKKRGKKPKRGSKKKKKRPSSMRPRPVNDKHKWKPRRVVDEDEDSQQGESQRVQKPLNLNRDEHRSSSSESRKRAHSKENKSREKDHSAHNHAHDDHDHKTPCSKYRDQSEDRRKDYKNDDELIPLDEPESSHSLAKPQFNDNQDTELDEDFKTQPELNDDDEEYDQGPTDRPQDETYDDEHKRKPNGNGSKEKLHVSREKPYHHSKEIYKNSREKSKRPSYDDDTEEEIRHIQRPKHKDNFRDVDNKYPHRGKSHLHIHHYHKHNPKPHPTPKEPQVIKARRKSPPKFTLARIFNYWMGGRGHRSQKAKKFNQPTRERGHKDETSRHTTEDNDYERFTFKKPNFSRTDDPFRTRNRRKRPTRRRRPAISNFNHKISSVIPLKRSGSSSSPYDFIQTYSPESNPEANDSFLRRNQVTINNRLKAAETQKLLQSQSPEFHSASSDDSSSTIPEKAPSSSVMSFVKNYFASKTPKHSSSYKKKTRPSSHKGNPSSISTLAKLISNPSALNPLKMLPIRRNRVRPQPSKTTTTPQVRHKLAMVNGELQILNITGTPTTTTTPSPIIHIGDDMSFEELTDVLSAVKKRRKQKIKLKTTTTTKRPILQSKKDYEYEYEDGVSDEADFVVKAEKKVDNDVNSEVEEEDANDGLKGIFIDIESGEVMALKPVAELTSFLPPKEEEPPTLPEVIGDENDDEDGDGVADTEIQRKQEIFSGIQSELKKNYDSMKKAHEKSEAKKKRKEAFVAKGMDESMDVVSKYFDMVSDDDEGGK